jgi:SAM-dependent methyltransferase
MYEVLEISLADTPRLFAFNLDKEFDAGFSLKSFDRNWTVTSRKWQPGERILDVGAGYSELPTHLSDRFQCEVWAADDFGGHTDETFWHRNRNPLEHAKDHPQVNFVMEKLGTSATSSLPEKYFDCVYSISALEHVPPTQFKAVIQHMDRILKPGGEMLHSVDIALPTNLGLPHVILGLIYDMLYAFMPNSIKERYVFETPKSCARFMLNVLNARKPAPLAELNTLRFVLNPEILLEPPNNTFNRILKDGTADARHFRVASLLIHLRKGRQED